MTVEKVTVNDNEEEIVSEKVILHRDADSHGTSESVKQIITDLLQKNIRDPLMPMQIHDWLNEKAQELLMKGCNQFIDLKLI